MQRRRCGLRSIRIIGCDWDVRTTGLKNLVETLVDAVNGPAVARPEGAVVNVWFTGQCVFVSVRIMDDESCCHIEVSMIR